MQQVGRFELTGNNSLYILLPRSIALNPLQAVERRMTYSALQRMVEEMRRITPSPIEVTLPLIKLEYEPNMHVLFKKLGWLSCMTVPVLQLFLHWCIVRVSVVPSI